jgi:transcriptional regulator with XRE-family HTH domain
MPVNKEDIIPFKDEVFNKQKIKNIGIVIKEARKKANLTQEELARKIGTKRSYISRIERDSSGIGLATLIKIVEQGLGGRIDIRITI